MYKSNHYKRLTDCSLCSKAADGIVQYFKQPKGFHSPVDKCKQNCMLFVLKGELLINSNEYPETKLSTGQFVLQSIGSKLEMLAIEQVEYLIYWFSELPQLCDVRYHKILALSEPPSAYSPLTCIPRLNILLNDVVEYLDEQHMPCGEYLHIKMQELIYILTCYYPLQQLSVFFYPISCYTHSFHSFVMQNYDKVKNVDDFARLGGYTTTTFRRIFKKVYGKPVYEWILNKKREGILHDLQFTNHRISEISNQYGFDSLSHFAHFCTASFGDSPRALRMRAARGEVLQLPVTYKEG